MSDGTEPINGNGSSPQGPDPRLAPAFRVTVISQGGQVKVEGNAQPDVCAMVLADGIKCMIQHQAQQASKSLVVPANGSIPPLRRLPKP